MPQFLRVEVTVSGPHASPQCAHVCRRTGYPSVFLSTRIPVLLDQGPTLLTSKSSQTEGRASSHEPGKRQARTQFFNSGNRRRRSVKVALLLSQLSHYALSRACTLPCQELLLIPNMPICQMGHQVGSQYCSFQWNITSVQSLS